MSQIASFYLIKNNQRKELSDGNCSGAVYMAIWDWCEYELDLDVRFPTPQRHYDGRSAGYCIYCILGNGIPGTVYIFQH